MPRRRALSRVSLLAALVVCALAGGGCASLRLPRIDPTGERVFIWPRNQVPIASPVTANPFGNALAQPVLTDPVFPQQPVLAQQGPIVGGPNAAGAALPPGSIPIGQPMLGGTIPIAQNKLTITPERVLAPVGSEVLLRTGICTTDGFLLANQRIEWILSAHDTGEIVELGGRGWLQPPLLPWNLGKKRDNHYAIGYTASVEQCIRRGNADPSDDLQVRRGDAWVSVTSATEGTSHVTAFAPAIESWQHRRATATIYWVDVQWIFPPPSVAASETVSAGRQVLTTTVTRQTDGRPLEGWLVRYEVAGGDGALVGGGSPQVVEVLTGADGKASVDVTPTGSSGSSQINTQLVRPARLDGNDSPRLIIGNGTTTINWNGTSPYLSSPEDFDTTIPTYPIPGNGATQPIQPAPTTPPPTIPATPVRKPRLELEIRGAKTAKVDGQAQFDVLIRNTGDGIATGIVLTDRFDQGLRHLDDTRRELEIENPKVGDLLPGQSKLAPLTFDVLRAGQLCHDVSVTCLEGSSDHRRACIEAVQPPPQLQPRLEVLRDGPDLKTVGEIALFTITVKNTGETPLTNVEVVDEYDTALRPRPTMQGYEIVNGRIVWRIPRLEVGQVQRYEIECECMRPAQSACGLVRVTADGGAIIDSEKHCVEIRLAQVGPPVDGDNRPPAAGAGNLRLSILSYDDPIRVGTRATYQIVIRNAGTVVDEQVMLSVAFPQELAPDVTTIQSNNIRHQLVNNEVRFEAIATLRVNEPLSFTIVATVNQPGGGDIVANVRSRDMPQGLQKIEKVEIIR